MHYEHGADLGLHGPELDVLGASAELDQNGVQLVGCLEEVLLVVLDGLDRFVHVGDVQHLYLSDHNGVGGGGLDAVAHPHEAGHVACRGHDAGLLTRHGDEVVLSVYPEVNGDAEGVGDGAHHVLGHPVSCLHGEASSGLQGLHLLRGETCSLGYDLYPFVNGFLVET